MSGSTKIPEEHWPRQVEIVVRGRVGASALAGLEGFDVTRFEHGLTHLVGWVADQAHLHGVLGVFDVLHVDLISVNPIVDSQT